MLRDGLSVCEGREQAVAAMAARLNDAFAPTTRATRVRLGLWMDPTPSVGEARA